MGGIAIEVSESLPKFKRFLPTDANETWFVSIEGIRDIIKSDNDWRNVLPNLSEENIKSKSKANGIAKALVCIQALWFIAQCLSRCMSRISCQNPLILRETFSNTLVQSHNDFPSACWSLTPSVMQFAHC